MKKKIQDALELAYKDKLGLTDKKAYARVAALGETYVAKEEDIPAFVEKAEDLLKGLQGAEDQGRTLASANAKIAELEGKLKKYENPDDVDKDKDKGKDDDDKKLDWAATLKAAIAEAVTPLTEKITALENINSTKAALTGARDSFFGGDYAKKYKDEANDAWERAVEVNELMGNKMTAEELAKKASDYFNKAVSRKGVDTSKPFKADPPEKDEEGTTDWSAEKKRLQDAGRLPKEQ